MKPLLGRIVLALVALGLGAGGYLLYQRGLAGGGSITDAAQILAGTELDDLAGGKRTLTHWTGKVVVVNFWATWCPPCREEIPGLIAVRQRFADQGVEVVGVAIDTAEKVQPFAQSLQIDYPLLLGQANALELMRRLGNATGALPYTLVLDRKGAIAARHLGLLTPQQVTDLVQPLLR